MHPHDAVQPHSWHCHIFGRPSLIALTTCLVAFSLLWARGWTENKLQQYHPPVHFFNSSLPSNLTVAHNFSNQSIKSDENLQMALPIPRGRRVLDAIKCHRSSVVELSSPDKYCAAKLPTCPSMTQCNPEGRHAACKFNADLSNYAPPSSQDTKELGAVVWVIPSALLYVGGNLMSQSGRFKYSKELCTWGACDAAKDDLRMALYVPYAADVTHPYAVNFYHFIAETLPKYFQLAPLLRKRPQIRILAAHSWNPVVELFFPNENFTQRSVQLPHWGRGKPKENPRYRKFVQSDFLYVPSAPRCGIPPALPLAELRASYLSKIVPQSMTALGHRNAVRCGSTRSW
eukprot:TRINITY_DN42469_c0_g1_i1.p1 TRINITY_DN42469_c0_g1~~TRINITY_DN42469_c0_g1_i1.p1  ORF type:complete len:356 (+),score=28.86 TRINITY_DN42469_c0_g1_i1:38-1069(+)